MNGKTFFLPLLTLCVCFAAASVIQAKELPLPGELFRVQGCEAFLIPSQPGSPGAAKTWVWYAPTLPKLPGMEEKRMFEAFRDAGISVAGIDVGESYGSPAGRKLFDAFYAEMTGRRGFAAKPVLLGRSRGGLMTLSWAADHSDKIAAFAGIYPVSNLSSYPGLAKAAPAYGMKPEGLEAHLAEHNPIDRLAGLARAQVPLFVIHGDNDKVVPLEENSALLSERYKALGGPIQLVVAAGHGHDMWTGFFECPELIQFVITHANTTNAR